MFVVLCYLVFSYFFNVEVNLCWLSFRGDFREESGSKISVLDDIRVRDDRGLDFCCDF